MHFPMNVPGLGHSHDEDDRAEVKEGGEWLFFVSRTGLGALGRGVASVAFCLFCFQCEHCVSGRKDMSSHLAFIDM